MVDLPQRQTRQQPVARPAEVISKTCLPVKHGLAELAYAAEFAAGFARLGQRPGVIFQPFFLDGVAGDPALNQADHIHPNPTGMPIVVAHILPFVLRLLDAAR